MVKHCNIGFESKYGNHLNNSHKSIQLLMLCILKYPFWQRTKLGNVDSFKEIHYAYCDGFKHKIGIVLLRKEVPHGVKFFPKIL